MAARSRRGGGFITGALSGLLLAGAAAAALSLLAPRSASDVAGAAGPRPSATASTPTPARNTAPTPQPAVVAARPPAPPPAPPPPAWRRNAAAAPTGGGPLVAVVAQVADLDGLASWAQADVRPATLLIDLTGPLGAEAEALADREDGVELVAARSPASPAKAVAVAARRGAPHPDYARRAGLLAFVADPAQSQPDEGVAADFAVRGEPSAERVFQTLLEATRGADPAGAVVVIPATAPALRGYARWAATTGAQPAPLTAVHARRAGDG